MLVNVLKGIHGDEGDLPCHIATDCFYTMVDNIDLVIKESGHYIYGTIRKDHGTQYCTLKKKTLPNDGDYIMESAWIHIPLTVYKWRTLSRKAHGS